MSKEFLRLSQLALSAARAGLDLDARLLLGAAVTALALLDSRPVIVGGTAVDFWSANTVGGELQPNPALRASMDVDIVVGGYGTEARALRQALADSGYFSWPPGIPIRANRTWITKEMPMQVEIIDAEMGEELDRVATIHIEGATIYLWGPEDTAWQYAENALSMRERPAWARARAIAAAQELDWDCLARLAKQPPYDSAVRSLQAGLDYDEMLAAAQDQ